MGQRAVRAPERIFKRCGAFSFLEISATRKKPLRPRLADSERDFMASSLTKNDSLIEELIRHPHYKIQEDGQILTCRKKGTRTPTATWRPATCKSYTKYKRPKRKSYLVLWFSGKILYAHRIVWAKFRGRLSPELCINHKDKNTFNNAIENLELVSGQDNTIHGIVSKGYRRFGLSAAEAKALWIAGKNKSK